MPELIVNRRQPRIHDRLNELAVEVVGIQRLPTPVREREPAWIEPEPRRLNLLAHPVPTQLLTVTRSNTTVRLFAVV